jgi:hypothetical protein
MTAMEVLFPRTANKDYRGGTIALVAYCLFMLPTAFSALVHFLKDDNGIYSIATLIPFEGNPDPDNFVMAIHSMMGGHQTLLLIVFLVVLWRYRNLIPLMLGLLVLQDVFQLVTSTLHPIGPEYFQNTPPGKAGHLPRFVLHLGAFFLCLFNSCRASTRETPKSTEGS